MMFTIQGPLFSAGDVTVTIQPTMLYNCVTSYDMCIPSSLLPPLQCPQLCFQAAQHSYDPMYPHELLRASVITALASSAEVAQGDISSASAGADEAGDEDGLQDGEAEGLDDGLLMDDLEDMDGDDEIGGDEVRALARRAKTLIPVSLRL